MFVCFFHSIWMLWKVSFYSVNGVLRTWLDPRCTTIIQWAGRRWSKEKEPSEHFKSKQQQKWDENVGSTCSILLPSNKKVLYFQFILKIPISNNSLSWLLTQSLSATKTISHYRHWFYIQYTCMLSFFSFYSNMSQWYAPSSRSTPLRNSLSTNRSIRHQGRRLCRPTRPSISARLFCPTWK